MGDSVYPYACANASSTPDVAGCEMWSNELSLAAQLVGCFFASRVALDGRNLGATLWAPVAVYTGWFGLLLYTSWSGALSLPRLSERGVLVDLFVLRGLGPYFSRADVYSEDSRRRRGWDVDSPRRPAHALGTRVLSCLGSSSRATQKRTTRAARADRVASRGRVRVASGSAATPAATRILAGGPARLLRRRGRPRKRRRFARRHGPHRRAAVPPVRELVVSLVRSDRECPLCNCVEIVFTHARERRVTPPRAAPPRSVPRSPPRVASARRTRRP